MDVPNYLKRSPKTGAFSFRLVVPKDLREVVGKREIKQALKTKDVRAATIIAMKLYANAQETFRHASKTSEGGPKSPLRLYQEALDWLKTQGLEREPKSEDELDARFAEADRLIDQIEAGKADDTAGFQVQALQGTLKAPSPSVSDAVALYLEEKNGPTARDEADRLAVQQQVKRYEGYLVAALGSDKPLTAITRSEARAFRNFLLGVGDRRKAGKPLKPGSVNRTLQIITAIFNHAVVEWELGIDNPFRGLKVEDAESKRDKCRSFTDDETAAYVKALATTNEEARLCALLMVYTGARTKEITGLERQDLILQHNVPHMLLRPNGTRARLKTDTSKRSLPLIGAALEAAREALAMNKGKPCDPLFPRYARPRGNDALSATLMKVIRSRMGIDDPKLVAYSARHTMKDRLRNALVPADLQDAIMGHSKGQVSEGYGDGYWLPRLAEAMERALSENN